MTGTVVARRRVYIPFRRLLTVLPLIGLPILVAGDLSSIALVHIAVPDDASEAARAGMFAVRFDHSTTPQTAQVAFDAASDVAALHRLTLDTQTFTLFADGTVELTASRKAPTLLFKHLPGLKKLTVSTESVSVGRPTW